MPKRAVLCLLAAGLCSGQAIDPRVEQIIQSHVANHDFMGTVLIAKGDSVLLSHGYGSANLEWAIPNSPKAKFRLGSVTKQFTAAGVLLLQERGKWKTADLVKKYMPDAPAAWDKVTLFYLLTHTSGITSFTGFPDYAASEAKSTTPKELVDRFREKPLEFEPGSKWNYSNSGYVLLGYLIEKVSGQTYEQFVQDNIFTPLAMKDSGYDSNTAVILNRASGYSPSKDGVVNTGFINMTIPFSAGALYSTTEDLLKWERGLFGGKLLSPESLKQMTSPYKENYAFGLFVSTANGHKKIDHGGGIEGFNTHLSYWPDDRLTIIVLGNLNGSAPDQISTDLGMVMHGERVTLPSERKEITVTREILQTYAGTYELSPMITLTVTLTGDQLEAQLTGQPKFPVFAESATRFFLKVVDAQLEFGKDAAGKVTQVTLHQNGRDVVCRKK